MFDLLDRHRVAALHLRSDAATGLRAIIAIHNTRFGPALGGCRCLAYPSTDAAIRDAVRLARGMSYKAVLAGIDQGGGKSVIIRPPGKFDKEAMFREFGRFVESLNGQYITAIDAGTSAVEMDWIHTATNHVTSTSDEDNPSVYTARTVFEGLKAAARYAGSANLTGLKVLVQGVGNVGYRLCQHLSQAGVQLLVSDIDPDRVHQASNEFQAEVVGPDVVYDEPCDIFAPCGLGGIINDQNLPRLRCKIIAGSANNQLEDVRHGQQLHELGILYAPDYVINAGGLIYASLHHQRQSPRLIEEKILSVAHTLKEIFTQARHNDQPTAVFAEQLAEKRLFQHLSEAA